MATEDPPVTQLLAQWRAGSNEAFSKLSSLVYDELRSLAQRQLRRERSDHTMQRTALVNEAFVRLFAQQSVEWENRSQFLALASSLMRRILVDHARARSAAKRGGDVDIVSLDELGARQDDEGRPLHPRTPTALQHHDGENQEDVAAIDEAVTRLAEVDPQQAKIVEMRYFGGLTVEQTADALGVSIATVKREWSMARAWLRCELSQDQ